MVKEKSYIPALLKRMGQATRLFAEVVSQLPTCDVCHDVHFIYTFDVSGKILQFIPLQLTKYGNQDWDEADIAKMRRKIVGRFISPPFSQGQGGCRRFGYHYLGRHLQGS